MTMKKLFLPLFVAFLLPVSFSCSSTKFGGYTLNEADAAAAIRQMLEIGTRDGALTGAFSKETVMATLFPEALRKTLNTLNQLGLTNEIYRRHAYYKEWRHLCHRLFKNLYRR